MLDPRQDISAERPPSHKAKAQPHSGESSAEVRTFFVELSSSFCSGTGTVTRLPFVVFMELSSSFSAFGTVRGTIARVSPFGPLLSLMVFVVDALD